MSLFRHYKNKNYKYIDVVKHSETLEDLVLYKPLYSNPEGQLWVRPKEMFFEDIEFQGKKVPRFQKIDLEIKSYEKMTPELFQTTSNLMNLTFKEWNPDVFQKKLKAHTKPLLQIAFMDEQAVGFKIGYQKSKVVFYSWLGGVSPEYRGLGVAQALMLDQHQWCRNQGYKTIQTKTKNSFKQMLMLNLNNGFQILSLEPTNEEPKIFMEKEL